MKSLLKRCDYSAGFKRNISMVFAQKFPLSCKVTYYFHYSLTARGPSCNSAYCWSSIPVVVSGDAYGWDKDYGVFIYVIKLTLHLDNYSCVLKLNFFNVNPSVGGSYTVQKQSASVPVDYTEVNSIGSIRIHIKCGKALPQSKICLPLGFCSLLSQMRQRQKGSYQCASCSNPATQGSDPVAPPFFVLIKRIINSFDQRGNWPCVCESINAHHKDNAARIKPFKHKRPRTSYLQTALSFMRQHYKVLA